MKNKKANLALNLIISATILLVVFFILISILSDKGGTIAENFSDCESKGYSCVKKDQCLPPLTQQIYKCDSAGEDLVCCN